MGTEVCEQKAIPIADAKEVRVENPAEKRPAIRTGNTLRPTVLESTIHKVT